MLRRAAGRTLPVVVLLVLAAVAVNFGQPSASGKSDLAACPMELGELQGQDLGVEEFVLEELKPSEILMRVYRGRDLSERVWLVMAYFENSRYGAHDPKVCYRSQGWQTEDLAPRSIARDGRSPIEAVTFRTWRRGEERLVMYWWHLPDDRATGSHRSFLNSMMLDGILRGTSAGAFIRISTPLAPDFGSSARRLDDFARRIAADMPRLISERGEGSKR